MTAMLNTLAHVPKDPSLHVDVAASRKWPSSAYMYLGAQIDPVRVSHRLQLSKVRRQIAASCTSTGAMLGVHSFLLPPLKTSLAVIDLRDAGRQIRHSFQHRGLQTRVQHQAAMALPVACSPCWGD